MRRAKKEIADRAEVEGLLAASDVGRLATIAAGGYPMIKPVNYVFHEGRIYFHSALEGEKIDDVRRDGRVCFEVDEPGGYVRAGTNPCSANFRYRSVIIRGRASIVADEAERVEALRALMIKYQPEGGYGEFLPEKMKITAVVRIDIEEISGKEERQGTA